MNKLSYREFFLLFCFLPIFIGFYLYMAFGGDFTGLLAGLAAQGSMAIIGIKSQKYICTRG